MKILTFAGSLRADSCNKRFAKEAARVVKELGHQSEFLDLRDYPMPVYDGDIEAAGMPAEAKALADKIAEFDAVIVSTPEYNYSIPGMLKNVIDWLSRNKPVSLAGKHLLLTAASPGALGGIRALWHTRQPFEALGVHVFPTMMDLGNAYSAFDAEGKLKDEKKAQQLKGLIEQFIAHAGGK